MNYEKFKEVAEYIRIRPLLGLALVLTTFGSVACCIVGHGSTAIQAVGWVVGLPSMALLVQACVNAERNRSNDDVDENF